MGRKVDAKLDPNDTQKKVASEEASSAGTGQIIDYLNESLDREAPCGTPLDSGTTKISKGTDVASL